MARRVSTSITRRNVVAGLALTAAPVALAGADKAHAQAKEPTAEKSDKSLYERLGGIFAIAAVVDHFSDAVVKNPVAGQKSKNPQLREWHTKNLKRLPGLKFQRTLWVANAAGGPFQFKATKPGKTPLGLEEAHRDLKSPPTNSMRSQWNSDGAWTSLRFRSARRTKSWQPSPPTKTRSPPAQSAADKSVFPSLDDRAQPSWAGTTLDDAIANQATPAKAPPSFVLIPGAGESLSARSCPLMEWSSRAPVGRSD